MICSYPMSLFAALNARVSKGSNSSLPDPGRAVLPARSLKFSPGPSSSVKSSRRREFDESVQFSTLTHSFKTDPEMGLGTGLGMQTIDENGDAIPTRDYGMIGSSKGSDRVAHTMSGGVTQVRRTGSSASCQAYLGQQSNKHGSTREIGELSKLPCASERDRVRCLSDHKV